MESAIPYVNSFIKEVNSDASISSLIKKLASERKLDVQIPKGYYIVTDLCNPCEAYWKRKRPDIHKPTDLRRKLQRGTQLHLNSSFWLKGLDGFSHYEGTLDGFYVGLPRVRGKVDYIFDDKILDLKTKPNLPKDELEVIEKYPQDVELGIRKVLLTSRLERNLTGSSWKKNLGGEVSRTSELFIPCSTLPNTCRD